MWWGRVWMVKLKIYWGNQFDVTNRWFNVKPYKNTLLHQKKILNNVGKLFQTHCIFTNVMRNFSLTIQNVQVTKKVEINPPLQRTFRTSQIHECLLATWKWAKNKEQSEFDKCGRPHKIKSLTYRIKAKLRIINKVNI